MKPSTLTWTPRLFWRGVQIWSPEKRQRVRSCWVLKHAIFGFFSHVHVCRNYCLRVFGTELVEIGMNWTICYILGFHMTHTHSRVAWKCIRFRANCAHRDLDDFKPHPGSRYMIYWLVVLCFFLSQSASTCISQCIISKTNDSCFHCFPRILVSNTIFFVLTNDTSDGNYHFQQHVFVFP